MTRSPKEQETKKKHKLVGLVYCVLSILCLVGIVVLRDIEAMTLVPAFLGFSCILFLLGLFHLDVKQLTKQKLRNSITGLSMFIVFTSLFALFLGTISI
jgi:small-conductance mechanosensitive channel